MLKDVYRLEIDKQINLKQQIIDVDILLTLMSRVKQLNASTAPRDVILEKLRDHIDANSNSYSLFYTEQEIKEYILPCIRYMNNPTTLLPSDPKIPYLKIGFDILENILRDKLINLEYSEKSCAQRCNFIRSALESKTPEYENVIIGDGTAGTQLHKMMTSASPAENTLVIADQSQPMQWSKDNSCLLGQTAQFQMPLFFASHTSNHVKSRYNIGNSKNMYNYVPADVVLSTVRNQQHQQNMEVLDSKILDVKRRTDGKFVIQTKIRFDNGEEHVFAAVAKNVHYCTGLGQTRYLSDQQVSKKFADKLSREGRIVYGNDFGRPPLPEKAKKVIIYGGGARACAIAHQFCTENIDNKNLEIVYVVRDQNELGNVQKLNRCFFDVINKLTDPRKIKILIDEVDRVDESKLNPMSVHFKSGRKMECDQLVVAIGQDLTQTRKLYQNLGPYNVEYHNNVPIGISSSDKHVFLWGAAGTDYSIVPTTQAFTADRNMSLYLDSIPREAAIPVSVLTSSFRIQMMYCKLMLEKNENGQSILPSCDRKMMANDIRTIDYDTLVKFLKSERKMTTVDAANQVELMLYNRSRATESKGEGQNVDGVDVLEQLLREICRSRVTPTPKL